MSRAEPLVTADHVHYLHSAASPRLLPWNHAEIKGAHVSLRRWLPQAGVGNSASLSIRLHPFSMQLEMSSVELRVLAQALLQCADDMAAARAFQPVDANTTPQVAA